MSTIGTRLAATVFVSGKGSPKQSFAPVAEQTRPFVVACFEGPCRTRYRSHMDCSATWSLRGALRACAALATLLGAMVASAATLAEFDDAQARIQYGFLTGDARTIESALREVEGFQADTRYAPLQAYQLAYGHWKLAQVYSQADAREVSARNSSVVSKAAKKCVEQARTARTLDPRMAEAYAIEAVCDGMPKGFLRLVGLTGSCARSRPLRTALSLEPQNPRVLLIEAMCAGGKDADGVARWRKVVQAFASASPSGAGKPDWGEAEALLMLGEHHLQRGEALAAREALEKAVALAPDFEAARELLAHGMRMRASESD